MIPDGRDLYKVSSFFPFAKFTQYVMKNKLYKLETYFKGDLIMFKKVFVVFMVMAVIAMASFGFSACNRQKSVEAVRMSHEEVKPDAEVRNNYLIDLYAEVINETEEDCIATVVEVEGKRYIEVWYYGRDGIRDYGTVLGYEEILKGLNLA